MPLPKTKNVGKIIHKLKQENGRKWGQKQMVAIALTQARKSGAKIPKAKAGSSSPTTFKKSNIGLQKLIKI